MSQSSFPLSIAPFSIRVEDEVLANLQARIRNTRWPDEAPGVAWEQGTDRGYLRHMLTYWAEEFDWRAQERELNALRQFRAELDGVQIHFVHEPATRGGGIPLILTHGWPSTFVELLQLVPLLTDPQAHGIDGPAFDVVIPSLPGYGFSDRPGHSGVNYRYTAGLWHRLMRGLGYERYGAQGGDFGAGVTTLMALDDPAPMIGIHLNNLEITPYMGPQSRPLSAAEQNYLARNEAFRVTEGGYKAIQSTKPQTLGYGLNDYGIISTTAGVASHSARTTSFACQLGSLSSPTSTSTRASPHASGPRVSTTSANGRPCQAAAISPQPRRPNASRATS